MSLAYRQVSFVAEGSLPPSLVEFINYFVGHRGQGQEANATGTSPAPRSRK